MRACWLTYSTHFRYMGCALWLWRRHAESGTGRSSEWKDVLRALGTQWSRCHFLYAFSSEAEVKKVNIHIHRVTNKVFDKNVPTYGLLLFNLKELPRKAVILWKLVLPNVAQEKPKGLGPNDPCKEQLSCLSSTLSLSNSTCILSPFHLYFFSP